MTEDDALIIHVLKDSRGFTINLGSSFLASFHLLKKVSQLSVLVQVVLYLLIALDELLMLSGQLRLAYGTHLRYLS